MTSASIDTNTPRTWGETSVTDMPSFAVLGTHGARLLAGPARSEGSELLAAHERRLGQLDLDSTNSDELRDVIAESGLLGRGGGQFPIARKIELAATSGGSPIVVVNASEGEPASRKDRTLLEMRPHLILDGAMVAAKAVNTHEIVIYHHHTPHDSTSPIKRAIAERPPSEYSFRIVDAPARYVAGESSAVISFLDGHGAIPRRQRIPVASSGVAGRPTVLNNAETIAHLALIARFGHDWFGEVGNHKSPGTTLVTLAGEVAVAGVVVEVLAPATIGQLLSTTGGLDLPPSAVLIGGYEGTWLDGVTAWNTPLDRGTLSGCGTSLGCGVIAVLGEASCGLATTSRLVRWLAGESAGQCGSCVFGLPAMADLLDLIADGRGISRDVRQLRKLAASLYGRGACGHPSGVVTLIESALDTFDHELRAHTRGRHCDPTMNGFPIPMRLKPKT